MSIQSPEICKNITRKLSSLESLFVAMHNDLQGHNTTVAYSSFSLNSDKDFSIIELKDIIKNLYQKHPILRGTIEKIDECYTITLNALFEDIPITIIENETEENWKYYLETELNTPLELDKYLWRVICFKPRNSNVNYLFFSCCHAVIDGGSSLMMLKDTLQFLLCLLNDLTPNFDILPFFDYIDIASSNDQLDSNIKIDKWPFGADVNQAYHTGVLVKELPIDSLSTIKPKLKEMNLSVNDYIAGIYLSTIQETKPNTINFTSLFTPVSLRMFTKPRISFDHVMCSAVSVNTFHNVSNIVCPSVNALDYQKQLTNILEQFLNGNIVNLSVKNVEKYMEETKAHRNNFNIGFGLSNIGRFDFGLKSEEITVNSFGFCGSRRGADCPILLCVMSDNHSIRFIFNYTKTIIQQEWVELFAEKFCSKFLMESHHIA